MKLCDNQNGFTVIEVLLVVTLLVIIGGIIKINTAALTRSIQLKTAANSIKNQLICAKTRALGDSRVHCGVYFDTVATPNRVFTFFDEGTDGMYDPGTDAPYLPPYTLPPAVSLTIGGEGINSEIIFRGDGSARIHGMQLSISDSDTREKIISVLPSTGRIKVIDP
jgi:prepilin-type N-terminal cleavage/methylation domain-containing protein